MIAHTVFFTLHDRSEAARVKLVKACRLYLTGHPGLVFFACGTIEPAYNRPVNDLEFDVSLHMIFADRPAHDAYQVAPRHQQFIDENKADWARVRVFDSEVETA